MHFRPHVRIDPDAIEPRLHLFGEEGASAHTIDVDMAALRQAFGNLLHQGEVNCRGGLAQGSRVGVDEGTEHIGGGIVRPEGAADVGLP